MREPLPPISSDLTWRYLTRVIDELWDRFKRSAMEEGDYRALWEGVRAVKLFSVVATDGTTGCYATLVCGNELFRVADFIEAHICIKPFEEWYGK